MVMDWSDWFKGYVSDQNQADEIAWDLSERVGVSFDGSTTDKDVLESVIDSFDDINSVVLGRKNDVTALVMVGDMPCEMHVEYSIVKIQPIVSFPELAEYILKNMTPKIGYMDPWKVMSNYMAQRAQWVHHKH